MWMLTLQLPLHVSDASVLAAVRTTSHTMNSDSSMQTVIIVAKIARSVA